MIFPKAGVPKTAPLFSENHLLCGFGQAVGFWRWNDFLRSHIASGIRMHQVAVHGVLVGATLQEKRKADSFTKHVSWAMLRGSFTHATLIF
jgi:hypothetical protein